MTGHPTFTLTLPSVAAKSSDTSDFDAVIVGAGLAGSALALALQSARVRCAIVEPRAIATPAKMPLRAIALSDLSRRILDQTGVWRALRQHACPVRKIHVSEQGVFGVTRICAKEEKLDSLGHVITAADLMRGLHQSLGTAPEVTVFSPASAAEIARRADHVAVVIRDAGGTRQLRARLVVLADGGASDFSRRLGFRLHSKDYHQTAVVAAVDTDAGDDHVAYERFTANGPLAVLPIGGCRRVIAWVHSSGDADKVAALPDADFIARLQRVLGRRLGRLGKPGARFSYPLELRRSSDVVRDRVVLLGDAAHRIHPVAGQGFNLTLRDVAFLAQCLHEAPDDRCASDALDAYQACRATDVRRVTRFTDVLARGSVTPGRTAACVRGAALVTLDLLPPLRRTVVRRSLGLTPPWPRLACSGLAETDAA